MSIEYAQEKLIVAVGALATGSGRLQERLADAAVSALIRLKPEDFPEGDLRRKFSGIMDDLTYMPAQGEEGRIAATLNATSDADARQIAKRIVSLYHAIEHLQP